MKMGIILQSLGLGGGVVNKGAILKDGKADT